METWRYKYRPNWIMYPKYFKATKTANECFAAIRTLSGQKDLDKLSVVLDGKRYPHVRRVDHASLLELEGDAVVDVIADIFLVGQHLIDGRPGASSPPMRPHRACQLPDTGSQG